MIANSKFKNVSVAKKWGKIKDIRKVITGALEKKRADKIIGSSLEAHINVYLSKEMKSNIENIDIAEIAITSSATLMVYESLSPGFSIDEIKGIIVDVKKSNGSKCNRCWKFDNEINSDSLCNRCKDAIKK